MHDHPTMKKENSMLSLSFSVDSASLIRTCALVCLALVIGMLGTFIATGIGQDPLQFIHIPAEYTQILLRNPVALKFSIGLDNAFILFYTTMFLAIGAIQYSSRVPKLMVIVSTGLLVLTGMLDMVENMHFLSMIASALEGMSIEAGEIKFQVWESLVKFHVSYLGLFLLGFILPESSRAEKILCFLLRWVQWPIGLLIYLVPSSFAKPLVLMRFSFFLISFVLTAIVYWQSDENSSRKNPNH